MAYFGQKQRTPRTHTKNGYQKNKRSFGQKVVDGLKTAGLVAGIGLVGAGVYNYGTGMNKDNTKNLTTGISRVAQNAIGLQPKDITGQRESTGTALMRTGQSIYDMRSRSLYGNVKQYPSYQNL